MTIILYGIPNCDTVKKARVWLQAQGFEFTFHDFKKQGVPLPRLDAWLESVGWESLLNRKGSTWRKLDPAQQDAVRDTASARALMVAQASIIKRPVVEYSGGLLVGFDPQEWGRALA